MNSKRRQDDTDPVKSSKKEKRGELASINSDLTDEVVKSGMRDAWRQKRSYTHGSIQLDCEPFSHCKITNFLQSESFVESLQTELLQLKFNHKSNDLYKFQQSDDLKKRTDHHITELRSVLFGQFRSWLSEVLEVELEPTVDISCAKYEHTDVLLCHDDELEGRRVAFILYLVPPWEEKDGGALDLFNTDEHCQPMCIVKSLLPCWNTLVFFEVSPISFHQVAEVIAEDKCRLSLSGWFHGPSLPRPPRYIEPSPPRHTHIPKDEEILYEWINEMYMHPAYQAQVQEEFEESSEIRLPNFLQEEKFKQVSAALQSADIQWIRRGPPNTRCYSHAEMQSLPEIVKECFDVLSSEPFFILLSNFTGLSLHYLVSDGKEDEGSEREDGGSDVENKEKQDAVDEEENTSEATTSSSSVEKKAKGPPECVGEIRRWTHGDYTLLHDSEKREFALDLLLHLDCSGWEAEFGGSTSYIAHDEDEELLTVYPEANFLALVYRDKETLKFIKHVNHNSVQSPDSPHSIYDFSFTYYE
ncbi:prolyl 3-hydroxylase OGFOD1 [Chanos chanos]|uniref:Prolyl 3-hydroxylase OGFOD1 n=1 Tax=Chanos chanos TaxID=29144 RepID=A0A6J2UNS1_CHACN|nr:prolyl 3-hydroxylase OGFOD1 [Chanos chanos]